MDSFCPWTLYAEKTNAKKVHAHTRKHTNTHTHTHTYTHTHTHTETQHLKLINRMCFAFVVSKINPKFVLPNCRSKEPENKFLTRR